MGDDLRLSSDSIFGILSEEDRAGLAAVLDSGRFTKNTPIFSYGDVADRLYVVKAGRVELYVETPEGTRITLTHAQAGDVFGEVALLDGGSRTASAVAVEETELLSLDRYDFVGFIGKHPHVALEFLTILAARLRRADELLRELVIKPPAADEEETMTAMERLADRVATFGGSWTFIGLFLCFMVLWVAINIATIILQPFDPYPFILLNLILSMLSAIQAPVIMMSQNRQALKDRRKASIDYEIGLRSKIEIAQLHRKVERFHEMTEANFAELKARRRRELRGSGGTSAGDEPASRRDEPAR